MSAKKPVPTDKFLITIPFWKGDKSQAAHLVKLLADLEPGHCTRADILLVNRTDCPPMDPAAVKYLSRKFNVYQHRSARKETGWPCGCNGLFFGMLEYVYHMISAGKIPSYPAIFNMASDVVPLSPAWIEYLQHQWAFLPANLRHPVYAAGALINADGDHPHINGDAFLMSGELQFLKWLVKDIGGIRQRAGWDWILADSFRARGWANIPGVHSLWQTPTMSRAAAENWRRDGAVLIHGVKDDSLLQHARAILL